MKCKQCGQELKVDISTDLKIWDLIVDQLKVDSNVLTLIQTKEWGWIPENIYKKKMEEVHVHVRTLLKIQRILTKNNLFEFVHLNTVKKWLLEQIPSGLYMSTEYMIVIDSEKKIITCGSQI